MAIPFSQVRGEAIKLKVTPSLNTQLEAGAGIAITKPAANIASIAVDFSNLVRDDIASPIGLYVGTWDATAGIFKLTLANALKGDKGDPGLIGYPEPTIFTGGGAVGSSVQVVAIQRTAPVSTPLTLPSVNSRNGLPLSIIDWSASVATHTISLTPNGSETIMKQPSFSLVSTTDYLASATLYPSVSLNGWYFA